MCDTTLSDRDVMRTQIDRLFVLLKTDLDHWGIFHHHLNKNSTQSQNLEQSICSKTQGEQNQLPCHSPQTPNSSVQTRTTPHLLLLNWSLRMIKGAVLGSEEKSMVPAFQGVHMCKRQMGGTEREECGGRAGGAELRTNQLQVVNWNIVTSTLKPPWSQLCVPSWALAFLWKVNHQHGLLTKPTPQGVLGLTEGHPRPSCPGCRLGLHSFPAPISHPRCWHYLRLAVALELEIPGGSRICSLKTKRSRRSLATQAAAACSSTADALPSICIEAFGFWCSRTLPNVPSMIHEAICL